ncbi:MAG: VOC family protein [Pseudomonadales bacterium]
MVELLGAAPQFLVADLDAALRYYRDRLGFDQRIDYAGFYASVARGAAEIHLKCAAALPGHREHRRSNQHLDAFIGVTDLRTLYEELQTRGARIITAIEEHPWGAKDFYVEDPDGYILCFSERA